MLKYYNSSVRGLHATYSVSIIANTISVLTQRNSCETLATDRGEGKASCTNCILMTEVAGSPLIYSTGNITVS